MDKRKNNGGHSTKAKGTDKRKNDSRKLMEDWRDKCVTPESVKKMMERIYTRATTNNDMKAAQIWLNYAVGSPDQNVNLKGADFKPKFTLNLNNE